jgi:hypothetical protein
MNKMGKYDYKRLFNSERKDNQHFTKLNSIKKFNTSGSK